MYLNVIACHHQISQNFAWVEQSPPRTVGFSAKSSELHRGPIWYVPCPFRKSIASVESEWRTHVPMFFFVVDCCNCVVVCCCTWINKYYGSNQQSNMIHVDIFGFLRLWSDLFRSLFWLRYRGWVEYRREKAALQDIKVGHPRSDCFQWSDIRWIFQCFIILLYIIIMFHNVS